MTKSVSFWGPPSQVGQGPGPPQHHPPLSSSLVTRSPGPTYGSQHVG